MVGVFVVVSFEVCSVNFLSGENQLILGSLQV